MSVYRADSQGAMQTVFSNEGDALTRAGFEAPVFVDPDTRREYLSAVGNVPVAASAQVIPPTPEPSQ